MALERVKLSALPERLRTFMDMAVPEATVRE
jgi:hypothetical protein